MKDEKKEKIKIGIIAIVTLLIIIAIVYFAKLFKKAANSKNLKLSGFDFELTEPLQLKHLYEPVKARINLKVNNFSSSNFDINQIFVALTSPSGAVVAQPTAPMNKVITLQSNKVNSIPLDISISTEALFQLLQENGFISGDSLSVLQSLIKGGMPSFNASVKGFIMSENIKININENLTNNQHG